MARSEGDTDQEGVPNRRERLVLTLLEDRDGTATIGELTQGITERFDEDADSVAISGDVHETLFEEVLPNLDDRGRIDFDSDRGVVSAATATEPGLVARLLERFSE